MLEISGSDRFKAAAILIVDDDEGMVRMATRLLRELGFRRVASATSGASAMQKLVAEAFDLVLSDWNMAPMSGLELLQHIRKDKKLAKAFAALTPGRQRGYVLHFSSAKQSSTRTARIEKAIPKILAGLGPNDR